MDHADGRRPARRQPRACRRLLVVGATRSRRFARPPGGRRGPPRPRRRRAARALGALLQASDGRADFSAVPKKDEMGMDYIPVYADEEPARPPRISWRPRRAARPCGSPWRTPRRPPRFGRGRAQDPLLPQPNGPAGYLAGAEEGPDGDGLHSRLRRGRGGRRHEGDRQGSPRRASRCWASAPRRLPGAPWSARCAPSAPSSSANASTPSSRPVRGLDREACTSTPRASRFASGEPLMRVYSPLLVADRAGVSRCRRRWRRSPAPMPRGLAGWSRALQRLRYLDVPGGRVAAPGAAGAQRPGTITSPFSGIVIEKPWCRACASCRASRSTGSPASRRSG